MHPLITLTSDFGEDSPYVAAMKGVILSLNPQARIVDLGHQIPPQDVVHGAFFLAEAVPYFPATTIHVAVVDPGVGTARALLLVQIAEQSLLVPDNGLWTLLARDHEPKAVLRLTNSQYWRQPVSMTFHGRDILAPVAAHLSLGLEPGQLGPPVATWVAGPFPTAIWDQDCVVGQVVFVDHFGNLISNISAEQIPAGGPAEIVVAGTKIDRWVHTYGEAAVGELVALRSSAGWLEIAVAQGNAARHLHLGRGAAVRVRYTSF